MTFQKYRRRAIAELRPYVEGEKLEGVSISDADRNAGSPKFGDMIARNPSNHADQWLVASAYFFANFEPLDKDVEQRDLFNEDVLEAPKPKRRVIHVDQGRRATNLVNKVDNPIIRMDNERGDSLAWGGTLTMVCHCGRTTCRFVQPKPDRAYVIVEDHVLIIDDEDKREE